MAILNGRSSSSSRTQATLYAHTYEHSTVRTDTHAAYTQAPKNTKNHKCTSRRRTHLHAVSNTFPLSSGRASLRSLSLSLRETATATQTHKHQHSTHDTQRAYLEGASGANGFFCVCCCLCQQMYGCTHSAPSAARLTLTCSGPRWQGDAIGTFPTRSSHVRPGRCERGARHGGGAAAAAYFVSARWDAANCTPREASAVDGGMYDAHFKCVCVGVEECYLYGYMHKCVNWWKAARVEETFTHAQRDTRSH